MIRPKLSLRRPLTMAVIALAGLTATVALQAPALAAGPSPSVSPSTTPTVSPSATPSQTGTACVSAADARYTHTFNGKAGEASITLTNGPLCEGQEQQFALVSYVAPSATYSFPQHMLAKSVNGFTGAKPGTTTLKFTVEVPKCFTQVDFVFGSDVITSFKDDSDKYGDRKVGSPRGIGSHSKGPKAWYNGGAGTCEAAPEVIAKSDCDGNVELTLVNRSGNAAATFEITGSGGFTEHVKVPMRELETRKLTAEQAKQISVSAKGMTTWQGGWTKPADCEQPVVGKPQADYDSTCDKMAYRIVNPANGVAVTSTITPSTGAAKTVTVAPGKSEIVTFAASEGFSLTVTGDVTSNGALKWTQPADCDKGGEGGGLPVTGAATTGFIAGAIALLALGAALFIMTRRRRVRFTA